MLVAAVIVLAQVLPTIAENLSELISGSDEKINSESTSNIPTDDADVLEIENLEDLKDAETSSSELEVSPAAPTQSPQPPPPPYATENQWMSIRLPTSIRVDPRSRVTFLPTSNITSLNSLMVCLSSDTLKFDVGTQQVIDDVENGWMVVKGDLTGQVLFAGDPGVINNLILTGMGLRIFREGATIGGQVAQFRLVDVSEPTTDESLCEQGSKTNIRQLVIVPLGLSQSITKSSLDLGKKSKP